LCLSDDLKNTDDNSTYFRIGENISCDFDMEGKKQTKILSGHQHNLVVRKLQHSHDAEIKLVIKVFVDELDALDYLLNNLYTFR